MGQKPIKKDEIFPTMNQAFFALLLTLPWPAASASPIGEIAPEETSASHPATAQSLGKPAGQKFEDRFTWNELFTCSREGERLSISVGGVFGLDAARMRLTALEQTEFLDIDVFRVRVGGGQHRWFHSWGKAAFDAEDVKQHASVELLDGKLVEFHRFGPLPDPAAQEDKFDARSFFTMRVDGVSFKCGIEYNPK